MTKIYMLLDLGWPWIAEEYLDEKRKIKSIDAAKDEFGRKLEAILKRIPPDMEWSHIHVKLTVEEKKRILSNALK